ncbi:MAG: hypothetical protein N2657_06045 [bacterium]|nr:hypothetical protein [bacterium]
MFVYRVVHEIDYKSLFLIDQKRLEILRFLVEINPLDNNISLKGVEFFMKKFKNKIHYAVFDTDFHSTIPEYAKNIRCIDTDFYYREIKKYGFHRISCSYVLRKLSEFLKRLMMKNLPGDIDPGVVLKRATST